MTETASSVRGIVKAANSDYAEAAAAIDAGGDPFLDVSYQTEGTGWRILVRAAYAVPVAGGCVATSEPVILADGQRLPRWAAKIGGAEKFCRWLAAKHFDTDVEVRVRRAGI